MQVVTLIRTMRRTIGAGFAITEPEAQRSHQHHRIDRSVGASYARISRCDRDASATITSDAASPPLRSSRWPPLRKRRPVFIFTIGPESFWFSSSRFSGTCSGGDPSPSAQKAPGYENQQPSQKPPCKLRGARRCAAEARNTSVGCICSEGRFRVHCQGHKFTYTPRKGIA